ncbi:MAG TPA: class I SAM-dependent methyltransferase [Chitinophagaceae bacterium]|nr:class I SAM-dependent methyltransferase [Chitinophagaceae bacterium]
MAKGWTGERLETFVYNEVTIEHLHRYALAMEYTRGKTVLDIACGEGYGSNLIAREAEKVVGVDVDDKTIQLAKEKYNAKNLEFLRGEAENIPCAAQAFDVVVSFETIEHTEKQEQMLREIKRVLKPGGLLIMSTPEKVAYTKLLNGQTNPFHYKELNLPEFEKLLATQFKFRTILNQNLTLGSVIAGENDIKGNLYQGDFSEIKKTAFIDPIYLIAFCSDQEIPPTTSSVFTSRWALDYLLSEKAKSIQGTLSYKTGHFLLWPLKSLYRLFTGPKEK